MKFKDLQIGQRFTRSNWRSIHQKIDPVNNYPATDVEIDPPTFIESWFIKPDDEVICVDDGWDYVPGYD